MKLALSMEQPRLDAPLERRFGRCSYFVVVDTDSQEWKSLSNPGAEAVGGAGTHAAQFLADQGVQAVISGDFGPKAFMALKAAGIEMYTVQEGKGTELCEAFVAGRLTRVTGSTTRSHHRTS